jgi:predicted nucleic acid-binding protein
MSETKNSLICLDANVVINALVPGPYSVSAIALVERWTEEKIKLLGPSLLAYEVTSVLRRMVYQRQLSAELGETAFAAFRQMGIRLTGRSEIYRLAWELAKELGWPRAYDTAYLAVAKLNACDFWTADERLFNAARPTYAWVRWVAEATP